MSKEVKQIIKTYLIEWYEETAGGIVDKELVEKSDYDRLKKSHERLLEHSKPFVCTPIDGDNHKTMFNACSKSGCDEETLCRAIREAEELL